MDAAGTEKLDNSKMMTLKGLNPQVFSHFADKSRPQGFAGFKVAADDIPVAGEGFVVGPEPKQHVACVDKDGTNCFCHGSAYTSGAARFADTTQKYARPLGVRRANLESSHEPLGLGRWIISSLSHICRR
jgi:hypothetical protein